MRNGAISTHALQMSTGIEKRFYRTTQADGTVMAGAITK